MYFCVNTIVFILFKKSQSSVASNDGLSGKYQSILIYGPMNSGKTVLFHQLFNSTFVKTQSSMNENILEFKPNSFNKCKIYQFIDYPGHGSQESRLYKYVFEKYNNKGLKAIIFTININDTQSAVEGAKLCFVIILYFIV